jgi:hypothetical protein
VFETTTVLMDNGYDPPLRMRVPADITVSLIVKRQIYFGQLPVPRVSGFKDEFFGKVITNAFQIGLLDADEVERDWLKLNSENEAPIKPVIWVTGLIGWAD